MSDKPQFNFLTRASVAAPVTSMEQAEALPSTLSRSSIDKSTDANDPGNTSPRGTGYNVSATSSDIIPGISLADQSPDKDGLTIRSELNESSEEQDNEHIGVTPKDTSSNIDLVNDVEGNQEDKSKNPHTQIEDAELTETSELTETVKQPGSIFTATETVTNPELVPSTSNFKLNFDTAEGYDQQNTGSDSVEVDPLRELSPEQVADPIEIPEELSEKPSESVAAPMKNKSEPEWLVEAAKEKALDGDVSHGEEGSHSEEVSHGALRKHSIAAMKELGTPDSPLVGDSSSTPGTPDEDAVFDYPKFMENLRSKSADPIARYIKSFLQEFSRGCWTPAQQEKIVADFLKFISFKLREHEPFASMSKKERRNSMEGVEKLIMTRLYTKTFPPKMPPLLRTDGHNEDLLRDQVFEERMRLWGWVEGRHLDINHEYISHETSQANFIQLATNELSRLHQFKSPRDKMICILNCSKVIFALIRQAKLEQNADSFLPLLIYVVLKSHPVHLISTINYIQRFRNREFQKGETAYYLSTLASAVAFLESLDKSSLTISDEEFEQRMADSVQAESNRIIEQNNRHALENDTSDLSERRHAPEGESSAAVLTASASMLVDRMRKMTTKLWEDLGQEESSEQSGESAQYQETQRLNRDYRAQARAAARASRSDYENSQMQRQQFQETLEMLQNMFPALDHDLVEDILRQSDSNVGSAVDLCLTLGS